VAWHASMMNALECDASFSSSVRNSDEVIRTLRILAGESLVVVIGCLYIVFSGVGVLLFI